MRSDFSHVNRYRVRKGRLATTDDFGANGAYLIPHPNKVSNLVFTVIASDQMGWEHVSVSLTKRTPTWEETCFIKDLFWGDDECVIQYHPPKSEYVNNHPHCLHLWKPLNTALPVPPREFVGV